MRQQYDNQNAFIEESRPEAAAAAAATTFAPHQQHRNRRSRSTYLYIVAHEFWVACFAYVEVTGRGAREHGRDEQP